MTLVFVVLVKERYRQVMQPDVDAIPELFVGVEALGSQPDLHLGEEMVIAWCQVRTVRRVVENLPVEELDLSICVSRGVGRALCRRTTPLVSIPRRFFWINLRSLFSVSQLPSDVIVDPGATNSVNKIPLRSQNTYLTAGGSGDDSVHVSSVITLTPRSENVRG